MKKRIFLVSLLLMSLLLFIACSNEDVVDEANNDENMKIESEKDNQNESNSESKSEADKEVDYPKAIDFTLKNLDGEEVSLSDYKGKKIFLNFWASWCGPCKLEMPDYEQFYKDNKDDNFVILAVNAGEDSETVKNFINENNYTMPVLLDSEAKVGNTYRVRGIPTTFLINEKFEIVSMHSGALLGESIEEFYNKLKE